MVSVDPKAGYTGKKKKKKVYWKLNQKHSLKGGNEWSMKKHSPEKSRLRRAIILPEKESEKLAAGGSNILNVQNPREFTEGGSNNPNIQKGGKNPHRKSTGKGKVQSLTMIGLKLTFIGLFGVQKRASWMIQELPEFLTNMFLCITQKTCDNMFLYLQKKTQCLRWLSTLYTTISTAHLELNCKTFLPVQKYILFINTIKGANRNVSLRLIKLHTWQ